MDSVGEVLEGKTGWFIRFLATLVNLCVVASATYMYNGLRNHIEIDAWYLKAKDNNYSFAQIVSLTLLGSSIIPLFKSLIGKFTQIRAWVTKRRTLAESRGISPKLKTPAGIAESSWETPWVIPLQLPLLSSEHAGAQKSQ